MVRKRRGGKGHSGPSEKKKRKEREKRAERLEKAGSGRSSTSASVSKTLLRRLRGKEQQVIQLKCVGRSRFWPRITSEAYGKLKKGEHAQVGNFSYIVDLSISVPGQVVIFDAVKNMHLGRKAEQQAGRFKLNVTEKTIETIIRGRYK